MTLQKDALTPEEDIELREALENRETLSPALVRTLLAERDRILKVIRDRDPAGIIDHNDMIDYGWTLSNETIVRAAIQHADGGVYSVPPPGRHHDCARAMGERFADKDEGRHVQGFLTSRGRFVDREEAHRIASAAGQIVRRVGGDSETLYSENLW